MPTAPAFRFAFGLTIAAIVLVTGCDSTGATPGGTPETTPPADLGGTSWRLASIGTTPVVPDAAATLTFEAGSGRLGGSTGCNNIMGTYAVDGASLAFGPIATTRRACEEPLAALETAVLDALAGVAGWEIDGDGRLHLTGPTELILEPAG